MSPLAWIIIGVVLFLGAVVFLGSVSPVEKSKHPPKGAIASVEINGIMRKVRLLDDPEEKK